MVYAIAGSRTLHKKKGCYRLKNTRKEINKVMLCADCAGEETEVEEK